MPCKLAVYSSIHKTGASVFWKRALPLGILLFASLLLQAQYFTIGTDPASTKWSRIRTDHFTVIFPRDIEEKAQHMANGLEYFYGPGHRSLNAAPGRYPVILHNRSVVSNAFVPYAPKRIEILTVTPQDHYSTEWLDDLIIHEFRHAVQYKSINTGFTKGLTYLFGEQAVAGMLGLFAPFWFIEGDAVISETAMSHSGRGRMPSFTMRLRAQFLEKGIYHYDKATHGSYEDFTPNSYELGYQLVGRTRVEFGAEVWAGAVKKSGQMPFMVVPFSHSLKQQTGYGKVRLYRHITEKMLEEWSLQDRQLYLTRFDTLTAHPKCFTNYSYPVRLDDGSVIAAKRSLDRITRIVRIREGEEELLFLAGTGFMDQSLSASGQRVCWGERVPDPRWDLRDWAVIMTYDLESGKMTRLTHRSRLFAPSINRQGDRIVAVEVSTESEYSLVVLDAVDGTEIKRLNTPDNLFYMHPSWSGDGTRITSVVLGKEGKSIIVWDLQDDAYRLLLPFSHTEISHAAFSKDRILYTASYSGIDNIYALSPEDGKVRQVTSSRFGATQARPDRSGDSMVFLDYSSDGYRVGRMPLTEGDWTAREIPEETEFPLAEALAEQEDFVYERDSVPSRKYPVKKYRRGLNLFNFHSWAPLYFDIDNRDAGPGVMLMSQNLLGTSYTTLAWEYDLNEEAGKYSLDYSYEGWYPVLDLGLSYGLRRGTHFNKEDSTVTPFKYHELIASTGVSVPLNWSVRSWFMGIRPRAGYSYNYIRMDPDSELEFRKDRFNTMSYRFFFYAQQKMSYRDLQPRWGQSLDVNFRHTLFDSTLTSNAIFSVATLWYLPGLMRHHGIALYGGYQERWESMYRFSNQIPVARGYSGIFAGRMSTLSATYVFPIFNPDWRIGPVLYLKRLKGAIFYDHTFVMDTDPFENYNTVGLDLSFDLHILSILAPLEMGLRSMYFPESRTFGFAFIWDINLDSLY